MGAGNSGSFSEDSFLTGKMAAAMCRGLGGKGVIPVLGRMVLADQETNYTGVVVMAGEQAIRELYLKPFEIALREGGSGMKAVMAGMNRVGPRWCGGHSGLLTSVLRSEWGFEGIVMTDTITSKTDEYADILEGLEAGTDLWQNVSNSCYKLRGGQLTYGVRTRFRTAAGRILQSVSRSNAMNGIGKKTTLKYKQPLWRVIRTALTVTAAAVSLLALWFALAQWKRRTASEPGSHRRRESSQGTDKQAEGGIRPPVSLPVLHEDFAAERKEHLQQELAQDHAGDQLSETDSQHEQRHAARNVVGVGQDKRDDQHIGDYGRERAQPAVLPKGEAADSSQKRGKGAEDDVRQRTSGQRVAEKAADRQARDRSRREEGQDRERFGEADLDGSAAPYSGIAALSGHELIKGRRTNFCPFT